MIDTLWTKDQWRGLPVHRSVLSPLMFLERALHGFGDKLAVVDGDRRLTYAELGARVYRLASALRARGVAKGDRVAVLCRNVTEMLELHFAVPQLGAILVPINVRLSSDEIAYILEHAGASVLVVDRELAPLVAPVRSRIRGPRLVIAVDTSSRHGTEPPPLPPELDGPAYEDVLDEGRAVPFVYPVEDEDLTISINYTSGTTGRPKGVMYSHRGAYLNALGEIVQAGLTAQSV